MRAPEQVPLIDQPTHSFTGHQTFSFRYSWLPKGVFSTKKGQAVNEVIVTEAAAEQSGARRPTTR